MTWPPSAGDAPPPGRGPASKSRVGCTKTVRRRRPPNPTLTPRRCLCCSFLDTVHDVGMREALRTVLEPGNNLVADPLWCPVSPSPGRHVHLAGSAPSQTRSRAPRPTRAPPGSASPATRPAPASRRALTRAVAPRSRRSTPPSHRRRPGRRGQRPRSQQPIPLSRARTMPSAPSRVSTTPTGACAYARARPRLGAPVAAEPKVRLSAGWRDRRRAP